MQLIIELQLSDMKQLLKGKRKECDSAPDPELALEAYREELESLAQFCHDKSMSQSIARAVALDGDTIVSHCHVEEQATLDREQSLSGQDATTVPTQGPPSEEVMDDEILRKLKHIYGGHVEDVVAESSSWAAGRHSTEEADRVCTACGDTTPFYHSVRCPCDHEYWRGCLADLFRASILDESLYPPRCCKLPIPVEKSRVFLPSGVYKEFREKEVEYQTTDRTYCHQPSCSAFIAPQHIWGDTSVCPQCQSITCVICKGSSHEGGCPEDPATQEMLRIAEENGWQRCRACHRLVELEVGCNHMSKPTLPATVNITD